MKFKVGDRVEIIKDDGMCPEVIGRTGTIIDVDTEWMFPYEVDIDNKTGLPHTHPDLFCDNDIRLIGEVQNEPVTAEDVAKTVIVEQYRSTPEVLNLNFTVVTFDEGDGCLALERDGELVMYGDDYHDKIYDRIEGFLEGLDYIGVKYTKDERIMDEGVDMYDYYYKK